MADDPPRLPPPPATPLLEAPAAPLLLAAPESRWKKHAKPITAGAVAGFLVVAFAIGWFLHHRRADNAEKTNEEARNALPLTTVVATKKSPALSEMLLPGSLSPLTEASLYARASGYVQKRFVDIGDVVAKGQVLATIESPELDQQVAQGEAAAAQARQQVNQAQASVGDSQARVDLARVTVQRYETLLAQDSIARQDVDVQRQIYQSALATLASAKANVGAAEENVRAAVANVRRLVALQRFEKLRAPFAGVITARSVDEGALVSNSGASLVSSSSTPLPSLGSTSSGSGSSTGSSTSSGSTSGGASAGSGSGTEEPLFRIAQVDRLRVYVSVPQENAQAIQVGSNAAIFLQEFADRFAGRVARTARAIDPSSRTLLTEVQVPNPSGTLMPGMYAQVRFTSARSNPPLLVPGEALIARAKGIQVAVLADLTDEDRQRLADPADARCARKVHLLPVVVGRDYGTEVEIAKGLRGGEFLLLNPSDASGEGAVILPQLRRESQGEGQSGQGGGGAKSGGNEKGGDKGGNEKGGNEKGGNEKGGDKKSGDKKGDDGKQGGDKQGGNQQGGKEQGKGGKTDAAKAARQEARSSCIDEQYRAAQAEQEPETPTPAPSGDSATSPTGGSSQPSPGGPSDRAPTGIQSPSIRAPSQGANKGGSGGKSQR